MATATYAQRGETLDYVNSGLTKIDAGTVIEIGARIGIAACDIPAGGLGAVHVEGVYEFPLADAAGMTLGAEAYWTSSGITATASTNTKAGYAVAAAAAGADTVLVKINA